MKYKIDNAGRISIPVEYRRELGINPGDEVKINVEDGKVVIQKCSGKTYEELIQENEFLMARENKLQSLEMWVNDVLNKYKELLKIEQNQDVASYILERVEILENIKKRIGE